MVSEAPGADASAEDVLVEISRRRNRIERALRELTGEGLRFAEGKKAMAAALAAVTEERRAILQQYSL